MTALDDIRDRLPGFAYSDYLKALPAARAASAAGQALRIAVLRSYTPEPIEPVLDLRLCLEGYSSRFFFGGFDQYTQELLDPNSELYRFGPEIVLLLIRVEELIPDFVHEFGTSDEDWTSRLEAKAAEIAGLARTFRERSKAALLVQNLSLSAEPYWGIYDAQLSRGQGALIAHFNRTLAAHLRDISGAHVWDFERFVRKQGYSNLFDPKMWYLAKNPYRQRIYPALVDDLMPYLMSILGRRAKCLVVDLDNTLWGGVVGEEGLEGIALGHTYPGLCYRDFQLGLLKLQRRGLILAINSKNNEADALRVIDEHPDMMLRREHFAALRINWNDKVTNLRSLADELNIGLDSMVMIDDNPAECDFIRQALPEVAVVCLPERPYLLPAVVACLPGTENVMLTNEDRSKGTMYREQAARKRHEAACSTLEEFLESLALEVSIEPASSFSVPRIAQLTQKTNQFNVTTRRYSEAEIAALAADSSVDVYSVAASDKFGDHGIVGVMIVRYRDDQCRIDTLLLSCRVIGRGIEKSMLAFLASAAQRRGARFLLGEFLPTAKNAPAAQLYPDAGFEQIEPSLYRADLEAASLTSPAHIRCAGVNPA